MTRKRKNNNHCAPKAMGLSAVDQTAQQLRFFSQANQKEIAKNKLINKTEIGIFDRIKLSTAAKLVKMDPSTLSRDAVSKKLKCEYNVKGKRNFGIQDLIETYGPLDHFSGNNAQEECSNFNHTSKSFSIDLHSLSLRITNIEDFLRKDDPYSQA